MASLSTQLTRHLCIIFMTIVLLIYELEKILHTCAFVSFYQPSIKNITHTLIKIMMVFIGQCGTKFKKILRDSLRGLLKTRRMNEPHAST